MTPHRNFSTFTSFPKLKNATLKGALFLSLSGLIIMHSGCSSGTQQDTSGGWNNETSVAKQDFTKGVVTTIEEVSKDEFTIIDEKTVETKDASRVIVKYLDGNIDTLTLAQVEAISPKGEEERKNYQRSSGMGNVLWWGVMGYYMGRSTSTPPNRGAYKNQQAYQSASTNTSSSVLKSRTTTVGSSPKTNTGGSSQTRTTNKPSNSSRGFFSRGGSSGSSTGG